MNRALPLLGLILFFGCQEELSIAEFEDEFRDYTSELRIEAVLDAVNPLNSIVRVDRTILITDTTIFNGRDDDGDWTLLDDVGEDGIIGVEDGFGPPPDDGEGNGRPDPGEPHVDEYDEILPQLHDSTAIVTLVEKGTDPPAIVIEFVWDAQADSFQTAAGPVESGFSIDLPEMVTVTYGGYRPLPGDYSIDYEKEYEFQIKSDDRLIKGSVKPLHPPTFIDSLENPLNIDTIEVRFGSIESLRWLTEPDATVVWVVAEKVVGPDSLELVMNHGSEATDELDDGRWIGEHLLSFHFPGLYRWTITVPSRAYGAYFYSGLPMRDVKLSNLRDENENDKVVLGIAGSTAARVQYIRILENPDSP